MTGVQTCALPIWWVQTCALPISDVKMLEDLEELLKISKDEDISNLIVEISELESNMKYASFPDILFQSFTVKKCQSITSNQDVSTLVKEINALKQRIENLEKGISSTMWTM